MAACAGTWRMEEHETIQGSVNDTLGCDHTVSGMVAELNAVRALLDNGNKDSRT